MEYDSMSASLSPDAQSVSSNYGQAAAVRGADPVVMTSLAHHTGEVGKHAPFGLKGPNFQTDSPSNT
ncbi:unnamed protein product [Strongylus vulgaris]|uniref:Uncharacterized protein n=1 Tax=Strongylus vulgaris TaxID=40348 RepID=A0A3P7JQS5_STRVU|nr:unnamed protein product [Strongylus vulgaris]